MSMIKFNGTLQNVIFSGDQGYKIASVIDKDKKDQKVIVGFYDVMIGQDYEFECEEVEHASYGLQYQVLKATMLIPKEGDDMIEFLSSSSFKNIGKRTAKKIVDAYGANTMDIIKAEPEKLLEIGVSQRNIDSLVEVVASSSGLQQIYAILSPLGFSEYYMNEVYRYITDKSIKNIEQFIKKKSYELSKNIDGITFEKIDIVYLTHGGNKEDSYRIENLILDVIANFCYRSGDTYITYDNLVDRLDFSKNTVNQHLEMLAGVEDIIIDNDIIILRDFYNAEMSIARNINNRLSFENLGLNEDEILGNLIPVERKNKFNYSDMQKTAIINSLSNNISIITGGPGTGKTTIVDAVVKIFKEIRYKEEVVRDITDKIILCAPTGRAAQRMKETTKQKAQTIHSLLEWDPYKNEFNRGIENPLTQELVIIDEFSMVDIFLANSIFKAIRPDALVVIVGDSAQLESVNPGNVMHDLMKYNKIPLVNLDIIFRQGEGSSIAKLAHDILGNSKLELINTNDMSVIDKKANLVNVVADIVGKSYKAGYDESEVQVLYPKYSGRDGIDSINKLLLSNKDKAYATMGDIKFYQNDKVMQLKNDYERDIYNGDIGFVSKVYNDKSVCMEVLFKDKKVKFQKKDLLNLTHAYAISIHKSQGSEFKIIILPISKESQKMMSKKLLYTAITRAKDKLIVVGDIECFKESVKKTTRERQTYLNKMLEKVQND